MLAEAKTLQITSNRSKKKYSDLNRIQLLKIIFNVLDDEYGDIYDQEHQELGHSPTQDSHYDYYNSLSNPKLLDIVCSSSDDIIYPTHVRILQLSDNDITKRAYQAVSDNLKRLQEYYGRGFLI